MTTNHLNLSYMMGAGLILSENGFGTKYYKDGFSLFPGQVVLFSDTIPEKAIEMSKQEEDHLITAIVLVSLDSLTGSVVCIDHQGKPLGNLQFPEELKGTEAALIMPAPLPISWVDEICFETQEDMNRFKESADDLHNVESHNFSIKVKKTLFKQIQKEKNESSLGFDNPFPWNKTTDSFPKFSISYDKAFALGGILAMFRWLANKSPAILSAYQSAFGLEQDISPLFMEPQMHDLWGWQAQERQSPATGEALPIKMFWGAVDTIARSRFMEGEDARKALFLFLKEVVETWQDVAHNEKLKAALNTLIKELDSVSGISDSTLSKLLDQHPKSFSRAVILFFLREKCEDLLEFTNERLTLTDIICAAILFGAREGWFGLSKKLRGTLTLQKAIVHHMADLAHRESKTGMNLGPAPAPPLTYLELFSTRDGVWTGKQKQAALILGKHNQWECIHSHIHLGKRDYQMKISGTGVEIVFKGMADNLTHEIDYVLFQQKLAQTLSEQNLPDKINQEVRKILGSIP